MHAFVLRACKRYVTYVTLPTVYSFELKQHPDCMRFTPVQRKMWCGYSYELMFSTVANYAVRMDFDFRGGSCVYISALNFEQ